jgi:DNA uptake protein ComE-like DNA-binding protein
VILSVLSVGLYKITLGQSALSRAMEQRIIGNTLAESCVIYARRQKKEDLSKYDTAGKFRKKKEQELGMGKFSYTIIDEESKININKAAVEIIGKLPGMNTKLAQAVNASALRPFRLKEEVLLVEGMSEEVYRQCKDFITVYGEGKVNINTAGQEVLKAVGFSDDLVRIIQDYRLGQDLEEDSGDEGSFTESGAILQALRPWLGYSGSLEAGMVQVLSKGIISVSSANLCLQIDTEVCGRKGPRYAVVIDKEKVKEWREY